MGPEHVAEDNLRAGISPFPQTLSVGTLFRMRLRAKSAAFLLLFGLLAALCGTAYRFIDPIYYSFGYVKVSNALVAGTSRDDQQAVVAKLFDFAKVRLKGSMLPPYGTPSYKVMEYGYGFCDQQSDVLMNLLYYQGVTSRVVPLYLPDGTSDHTFMEWWDGSDWLILDPLNGYSLPVSGRQLATLPKEELASQYGLDPEVYDFYAEHYMEDLKFTYATQGSYAYWGPLPEKKTAASTFFDRVAAAVEAVSPDAVPNLVQDVYLFKNYREETPLNQYLVARNRRLFGDAEYALATYRSLMESPDIDEDWPGYRQFSINKKMLAERIELLMGRN